MERKLASIQKILKIEPIPNADKIVVATVLGWEVVVKIDEFKVGDKIIYLEVDSIVPRDNPYFEFMMDRKYRVRTIKLRKQVSQGLIIPLTLLPPGKYEEGMDVTDILKVTKYDPQLQEEKELQNRMPHSKIGKFFMRFKWYRRYFTHKEKSWPSFIKKTDEERIQNMPWILTKAKGEKFYYTEKLDGQSATFFLVKRPLKYFKFYSKWEYGVCSRNIRLSKKDNSNYWRISDMYQIKKVLEVIQKQVGAKHIVLQGEIIGEGIQKNKYKLKGIDFHAFNLFINDANMSIISIRKILSQYNMKVVPILHENYYLPETVQELVKECIGKSKIYDRKREGIVIRDYSNNISFKVINPEFLLEEKE